MQAIEVARFGGPEVLARRDLPDPAPEAGQVVVATVASDVLFVDTLIRSGWGVDYFPLWPPYVPGNGVGGQVVAVGSGVEQTWLGREMVAHTGGHGGGGGYAQLVAVDLGSCAPVPDGVDVHDATAVLHDGVTALRILEITGARASEHVVVLGAAGGMGILLVQLLAAREAHVVGAARGWPKLEVVARAGAECTVDYGEAGWADAVLEATGGRRPSLVLDGVGGAIGGEAFALLADGGRFSAHGTASGSFAPIDPGAAGARGVRLTSIADLRFGDSDRSRLLADILEKTRVGTVSPLVGQTFPLAEASKAHRMIGAREAVAKTLLLSVRPSS